MYPCFVMMLDSTIKRFKFTVIKYRYRHTSFKTKTNLNFDYCSLYLFGAKLGNGSLNLACIPVLSLI